jgi:hypothetical protein
MRRATGNHFRNHYTFMACLVRKPWRPCHIANRIDTRHRSPTVGISGDMCLVNLDPQSFKPQIFHIAHDANSRDHRVKSFSSDFSILFDMRRHQPRTPIKIFNHGFGPDLHALLFKCFLREG